MRQSMDVSATGTGKRATDLDQQSTVELLVSAQRGDGVAKQSLVVRALPRFKVWARGRIPPAARGHQDTGDLIQDAVFQMLCRLQQFTPRHRGAVPAYLQLTAKNRVRDEARRLARRPAAVELDERLPSDHPSPLAETLRNDDRRRVRRALATVRPKDRRLMMVRAQSACSLSDLAKMMGLPSASAAGMALHRAQRRLKAQLAS